MEIRQDVVKINVVNMEVNQEANREVTESIKVKSYFLN